jgi:hypothetical protein
VSLAADEDLFQHVLPVETEGDFQFHRAPLSEDIEVLHVGSDVDTAVGEFFAGHGSYSGPKFVIARGL